MRKILSIVLVFIICVTLCSCKSSDYNYAEQLFEEGRYDEAHIAFKKLVNYKDSQDRAEECLKEKLYISALSHYHNENYIEARDIFDSIGDYKDSNYYANDIRTNAKPLFKLLEGRYFAHAGFARGHSYYYFDAEEKTFNLYFNNEISLIFTRSCKVIPTGDNTFYLTDLDEFGDDFDNVTRINCQVSDYGNYIYTDLPYDRFAKGKPYFEKIEE